MFARAARVCVSSTRFVRHMRTKAQATPTPIWNMKTGVSSFGLHKHSANKKRPIDCGEDAFFVCVTEHTCAADGVGGWAESGVDPSLFAWGLMEACQTVCASAREFVPAWDVLKLGYNALVESNIVAAGSSTACLVTVNRSTGMLKGANLGDSGLFVVRDGKVIFQSQEQQYYFNAPYQLAIVPASYSGSLQTLPDKADKIELHLVDGDIVILVTDGFLDNIFAEDLPQLLSQHDKSDVTGMAAALVKHAHIMSRSHSYVSPFAERMSQVYTTSNCVGGKPDDITVVVAVFSQQKLQAHL